jgi:F0F1-type ATP synthase membrane subunit b/b'
MICATGVAREVVVAQPTNPHRQQAEMRGHSDTRHAQLEREIDAAERDAKESLRLWIAAVRRMIVSAPSIGDALLEARDREATRDPR